MTSDRAWMYRRLVRGCLSGEFVHGVEGFIEFATKQAKIMREFPQMRCPCIKCRNIRYLDIDTVKTHLYQKGFCMNYFLWYCHGEEFPKTKPQQPENQCQEVATDVLCLRTRVYDASREGVEKVEEDRMPQVKKLRLTKKPTKISIPETCHSTTSNTTTFSVAQLEERAEKAEKRVEQLEIYLKKMFRDREQVKSCMENMKMHLDVMSRLLENNRQPSDRHES